MSFLMIAAILLGGFLTWGGIIPEAISQYSGSLSEYCLYLLLLVIGYDMGRDKETLKKLFQTDLYVLLVPVAVIVGTLCGGYLSAVVLNMRANEAMAVSAGFGWYSFSAVIIAKMHSADLGAVAFLANVFRELLSILLIPYVAKYFGAYPAVGPGGATTMDTTLPIIERYAGSGAALIGFINGLVLTTAVPFLIPIIL